MRIVIDLLGPSDSVSPAPLALASLLIPALRADDVELLVAAPLADRKALEKLRLEPGLAGRVRAIDLPQQAALREPVRRHALADLHPSVVLVATSAGAQPDPSPALGPAPFPELVVDAEAIDVSALPALLRERVASQSAPQLPTTRPKLAYVSPLPPVQSGIADYSAELVPVLSRYYDIVLIVDQELVVDARVADLPQHGPAWLRANAHQFERVVYHFGNSQAHQHMFELLRDVPGIVVLHDFFLSGVLNNLERENYIKQAFLQALYYSHGYTALLSHQQKGRDPSVWEYPVNKAVLDHANGVIVHSDFSRTLAENWYGKGAADGWRTVALLRGRADGANTEAARAKARDEARARLGIGPDEFIVTTFGMLGPIKLNAELLAAFHASSLATQPHCKLVFVGANDTWTYGEQLSESIAASPAVERITITGFVDAATYADWLAASDCAVQLRANTRGETSASVLDCLLYGLPTIVNAHGSTASLSDELVIKLDDEVDVTALAAALDVVRTQPTVRARLRQNALAHMQAEHAPEQVARLYAEAIEAFTRSGRASTYQRMLKQVAPACPEEQLPALAACIAFNRAPTAQRQLLVDVSAVVKSDLKTGIQRVVRSVVLALIARPPAGLRIEPVYTHGAGQCYRYARRYALSMVGETELEHEDAPVDLRPGDIFLGLDLYVTGTHQNEQVLLDMRARGVSVNFVIYDVLPMLRPDVFPFGTDMHFGHFLRTVHKVSDGVVCISRAVADELADWIAAENLTRRAPLQLGWFHLGADIDASAPSTGLPDNAAQVFEALARRPSLLMVGTVEPRKGHAQALAALDLLWQRGVDVNLVIVGKQGWMVDELAARLSKHPEKSKRLFWLAGISDEMLVQLYGKATALLNPSQGEGFGLPLIEAAQHGIPILARDIPVFREVAGEHASYFKGLEAADLADAIDKWLALQAEGKAPGSQDMPWLTWEESARQLTDALVDQQWYRTLDGQPT